MTMIKDLYGMATDDDDEASAHAARMSSLHPRTRTRERKRETLRETNERTNEMTRPDIAPFAPPRLFEPAADRRATRPRV